jgi:hypothetical protein
VHLFFVLFMLFFFVVKPLDDLLFRAACSRYCLAYRL